MKFALALPVAFGLLAVAAPSPQYGVSQCNTGKASCCNTVQDASSGPVSTLLGLLGIVAAGITGQVGLGCTPISVIGVGQGANCAQQAVCCTGNNFNGLINVGCTPISA
ncbi:hypothetical protein M422DRAFT_269395 [Sphaerobolus stellatus SS14]|uniref:Hydrophobin n=1 Tax=Sphaerobolus stellatus (strain SS14) TaxID=990650 RepID=A0A0C9UVI9_SPHS4|nr:hypothetical protein M422DRAFT_269395 [Sphaerobolus stellatus SS14]